MIWVYIIIGLLILFVPVVSFICFRMTFYTSRRIKTPEMILDKLYEPYMDYMKQCEKQAGAFPHKDIDITAFDGLKLHGKYFEHSPDSPIELMMHGYRGSAMRDLSGGILRGFQLGHSVLLVDQRCCGLSDGHVITFGIREYRDCLSWIDYLVNTFGKDRKIILTGISMGAATVLITAGQKLPGNVIGVLADCGYSSAKEIICSVIRSMKLPPKLLYPFVKLGAKLYGRFDPEETSPMEALKHSTVPVLFIHGESDNFVPCYMSKQNFEACTSPKRLVTIPGAGHCLCYPVDPERYMQELKDFF